MESNREKKGLLKALQDSFCRNLTAIAPQKLAKLPSTIGTEEYSVGEDGDFDHSLVTNGACHINTHRTSKPCCSADHAAQEEVSSKYCALYGPPGDITSIANTYERLSSPENSTNNMQSLSSPDQANVSNRSEMDVYGAKPSTDDSFNERRVIYKAAFGKMMNTGFPTSASEPIILD